MAREFASLRLRLLLMNGEHLRLAEKIANQVPSSHCGCRQRQPWDAKSDWARAA